MNNLLRLVGRRLIALPLMALIFIKGKTPAA